MCLGISMDSQKVFSEQPILVLYFEFRTLLKFYSLGGPGLNILRQEKPWISKYDYAIIYQSVKRSIKFMLKC